MQWLAQCHYLCKSRIREGWRKAKYFKIQDYFLDYYFSWIYTLYSLIIHIFHICIYQKQNEATSATEINVSRCLLWKYVMSNTTWVMIMQDLRMISCSALIFLQKKDDFCLCNKCLSQNQFAERGSFYQQRGVLPTLLVIFHLHCEMSPSSALLAPFPRIGFG